MKKLQYIVTLLFLLIVGSVWLFMYKISQSKQDTQIVKKNVLAKIPGEYARNDTLIYDLNDLGTQYISNYIDIHRKKLEEFHSPHQKISYLVNEYFKKIDIDTGKHNANAEFYLLYLHSFDNIEEHFIFLDSAKNSRVTILMLRALPLTTNSYVESKLLERKHLFMNQELRSNYLGQLIQVGSDRTLQYLKQLIANNELSTEVGFTFLYALKVESQDIEVVKEANKMLGNFKPSYLQLSPDNKQTSKLDKAHYEPTNNIDRKNIKQPYLESRSIHSEYQKELIKSFGAIKPEFSGDDLTGESISNVINKLDNSQLILHYSDVDQSTFHLDKKIIDIRKRIQLIGDYSEKDQLSLSEKSSEHLDNFIEALIQEYNSCFNQSNCNYTGEIATHFIRLGSSLIPYFKKYILYPEHAFGVFASNHCSSIANEEFVYWIIDTHAKSKNKKLKKRLENVLLDWASPERKSAIKKLYMSYNRRVSHVETNDKLQNNVIEPYLKNIQSSN